MSALTQDRHVGTGLSVRELRVETAAGAAIVESVDLDARAGRVVGIVGEPGAGKTTIGLALLGMARRGTTIAAGTVMLDGIDVLSLAPFELRGWCGTKATYVPEHVGAALNPAMRIGRQLLEAVQPQGSPGDDPAGPARVAAVLAEVGLPADEWFQQRWPHQLSLGEKTRVGLALAFAPRPRLVVIDDPTHCLDAITRGHLLDVVRELAERHECAVLFAGRDLAVVADVSDDVAVLYAGGVVERAATDDLAVDPRHPYTARLVAAVPDLTARRELRDIGDAAPSPSNRPGGCRFAPRCALTTPDCVLRVPALELVGAGHWARCIHTVQVKPVATRPAAPCYVDDSNPLLRLDGVTARRGRVPVLHDLCLVQPAGACTALVGGPGSGAGVLARAVAGLHGDADGAMWLRGERLPFGAARRSPEVRKSVSYVGADSCGPLDPRRTVAHSIVRPLRVLSRMSRRQAAEVAHSVLKLVELPVELADRRPYQLSAMERQRVAVARALVTAPDLVVCDEPSGALGMSEQAAVVGLLARLSAQMGFGLLFVTCDIALAGNTASHIAVLCDGRLVEHGWSGQVVTAPGHGHTRELIETAPAVGVL